MHQDSAPPSPAARPSGSVVEDLSPWEDVHGDIRRWSDPAVRALMDLAECGPLPSSPYVL